MLKSTNNHCHEVNLLGALTRKVCSKIKTAASSIMSTTRAVLRASLRNVHNEVIANFPKKSTLGYVIWLEGQKGNCPLPNPTSQDFIIPPEYTDMVVHDAGADDPLRILTLGHRDLLQHISDDEWFGDGTFGRVPQQFFQEYTIPSRVGSNYPPFLYFILLNKTEKTYVHVFQIVELLVPGVHPNRECSWILKQEHTMHSAVSFQVFQCQPAFSTLANQSCCTSSSWDLSNSMPLTLTSL